jgi:hypothetical protein
MKNILLLLLIFICSVKTYEQTSNRAGHIVVEIIIEKRNVLTKVEVKSSVPLTDSGWMQNLEKNITESIRSNKRPKKGKYIVSVRFITDKQGNVSDIICEKDPGFGMCEHVVRVVKKSPKWGSVL